jgi:hypothetical protein
MAGMQTGMMGERQTGIYLKIEWGHVYKENSLEGQFEVQSQDAKFGQGCPFESLVQLVYVYF